MDQGKILLDDMRSPGTHNEVVRRKNNCQLKGPSNGFQSSVRARPKRLRSVVSAGHGESPILDGREAFLDDNASDTSDLISFTSLEMDQNSSAVVEPYHEMHESPIDHVSDPDNDLMSTFPTFDDGFSASDFEPSYQSPIEEDTENLRSQLQKLIAANRALKIEKQIAEERADHTMERITELEKPYQKAIKQTEDGKPGPNISMDSLQAENRLLREQLSDSQSHIFSLQPYRKELTPEEMGREYDDMIEKVQDWAEKLMSPYLDDHAKGVQQVMAMAKKSTAETVQFKRNLQARPDLVQASLFPETDEDIVVALVLRYLHDAVFQKILYGELDHYTEVLSLVETHMHISVQPKRDLFSVRNWTAESYNALISAPQFQKVRERTQRRLTMELGHKLKVLCKKADWEAFCQDLSEMCVQPAMQLYEKMQVSTHHFYLDINPMKAWRRDGDLVTSPEFYTSLDQLDCRNVLQHRKAFSLARLDPKPSRSELEDQLFNVCAVAPALYMRRVGQRDAIKEPTVLRKQLTLVAWGTEEARREYLEGEERTIASHLCFFKEKGFPWS